MLLFATSDKGGTGRSVTSSNLVYRQALQGLDVSYVDYDFGSPTAGAVFDIARLHRGVKGSGLHSYLAGEVAEPVSFDVWTETDREELRRQPPGAGRLVLYPGDQGGGEFFSDESTVERCVRLFLRLEEQFEVSLIDLSAGRSYAIEMALEATADRRLRAIRSRWLVFHRWTRQHILSAADLVYGDRGILKIAAVGDRHDPDELRRAIRFVRTAVVDPASDELAGLRPEQVTWLREFNLELRHLAGQQQIGRTMVLGSVPLDPILQWREQLITDEDVARTRAANAATAAALADLAKRVLDEESWEGL